MKISSKSKPSQEPALSSAASSAGVWWVILVGLVSAAICAPFFRTIYGTGGDEGLFLHGAELMLRGRKLYTDFFEFLPPGSYLITAVWFGIAGVSFESARALAILIVVGIACFTFLACRQASKNALLSAALTCGWVFMSQWHFMQVSQHWFTTFFSMAAAWAALASLEKSRPRILQWPIIAGAAAGAATMVMETCGVFISLAAAMAFADVRHRRAELIAYVCAIALVPAGILLFLVDQHTLAAAYDDVVRFTASRYAPVQYVWFGYGASIFDFLLIFVFPLAAVLTLLVSVQDWRAWLRDRRLSVCAAIAVAGLFGCFPRPDIGHIGFTTPLAFPLLALCVTRLCQRLGTTCRTAFAAATIAVCVPSAVSFYHVAWNALQAPVVQTARGKVSFLFTTSGVLTLLPRIAATQSHDALFIYPYMPMLAFLVEREHASKYDGLVPGYSTPAQYREACLSAVRDATWVVIDRRFAVYDFWKQAYPSMPDAEPQETVRIEQALGRASETVATYGIFELRRRRADASDRLCDNISAEGTSRK